MAVDWDAVSDAIRLGKTPERAAEALELLISFEPACESNRDRGAVCIGKAMCYANLGQLSQASDQIKIAKHFAGTERDLMLQIELSEAANLVLSSEYRTACDMYERIGVKYSDLLAEDRDSAQEFQERFGYALVHVKRYRDAVPIFQQLLGSNQLQDEQRVRLFLGAALAASGHSQEARLELELAAKGPDPQLSRDALERLMPLHEIQ